MWKFIKSSSQKNNWYINNNKEICFVGRSNVGKSSLINALANQKIAKTSNTPGRTQLINFFEFDNKVVVDLPGYGYAKMPKAISEKMALMVEEYLYERKQLICIFVLVSAKVGPTKDDIKMLDYLKSINKKTIIIITKSDKAKQSQRFKTISELKKYTDDFIITSSQKGQNISKLRKIVSSLLT